MRGQAYCVLVARPSAAASEASISSAGRSWRIPPLPPLPRCWKEACRPFHWPARCRKPPWWSSRPPESSSSAVAVSAVFGLPLLSAIDQLARLAFGDFLLDEVGRAFVERLITDLDQRTGIGHVLLADRLDGLCARLRHVDHALARLLGDPDGALAHGLGRGDRRTAHGMGPPAQPTSAEETSNMTSNRPARILIRPSLIARPGGPPPPHQRVPLHTALGITLG